MKKTASKKATSKPTPKNTEVEEVQDNAEEEQPEQVEKVSPETVEKEKEVTTPEASVTNTTQGAVPEKDVPAASVSSKPVVAQSTAKGSARTIAMLKKINPAPTIGVYNFQRSFGIHSLEQNKQYTLPEDVAAVLVNRGAAVWADSK